MSIFSRKPHKKPHQKRTPDQEERRAEVRRKRIVSDWYIKLAEENPRLKRQMIAKEYGFDLPEEEDPDSKIKSDIRSNLVKAANKMIEDDPELKEQWAEMMIPDIIGKKGPISRRGEDMPYMGGGMGSSLEDLPELLDTLDGLKNRLGGGGNRGFVGSIFNEENVGLLLKLLVGMKTGELVAPAPANGRTYVIQVDGQTREVTEKEFKQLQSQGRLTPVAALTEKTETKEPDIEALPVVPGIEADEDSDEESDLPEFIKYLDLAEIGSYLDMPPESFVDQLASQVSENHDQAKFLWGFLGNTTADAVIAVITPYQYNFEVAHIVERLASEEGKEWLTKVIQLIKEKSIGRK